jgi:hypothetical protein
MAVSAATGMPVPPVQFPGTLQSVLLAPVQLTLAA